MAGNIITTEMLEEEDEVEISPGVYMTDYRSSSSSSSTTTTTTSANNAANSNCGTQLNIAFELTEIENSIKHLIRSNVELARAMEDDPDPIYSESIQENLVLIEKRNKRKNELLKLQNQRLGR